MPTNVTTPLQLVLQQLNIGGDAFIPLNGPGRAYAGQIALADLIAALQTQGAAYGLLAAPFSLTALQLASLDTVPITLVAAPGASLFLVPHFVTAKQAAPVNASGAWADQILFTLPSPFTATAGSTVPALNIASPSPAVPTAYASSIPTAGFAVVKASAENQPLIALGAAAMRSGGVQTAVLNAGGSGYAVNDTGTIDGGAGTAATYKVLTVDGGGAVLTFSVLTPGTKYGLATGATTTAAGAQAGIGTGLTLDLTAIYLGGAVSGTLYYTVEAV